MWTMVQRRTLSTLLALTIGACVATLPQVAESDAQPTVSRTDITFVLTSDVYKMGAENGRGGLARIAAVLKAEKAAHAHSLSVHAGDTISPSLMSGFDKGAHIVDLFNMSRLDIFVPGNHEFDFGPDIFVARMHEMKSQVLAANLRLATGAAIPGILPSKLLTFGPVKVGIVGLTDEDSPITSKPGGLRFANSVETAEREAARLRTAGADLIVLVVHADRTRDEALFNSGAADLILSGHDHDLYMRFNEKTAIAEAGEDGMAVVAVDLSVAIDVKADGKRRVSWWPHFRFIDTADVQPDPDVQRRVAQYEAQLSKDLDVPAGRTTTELDSRNAAVRGGEAAIGNLFADALRDAAKSDIALLNGGGFRGGKLYPAGSVLTRKDVLSELPFLNKAYVLEIRGSDLLQALEQGLTGAENEVGRFPQVSGMKIRADVTKPEGHRVVSVQVGGKPLNKSRNYRLVTNDYLANGGDGYAAFKRAKVLRGDSDADVVTSVVISYLEAKKDVSPTLEGRIMVVRSRAPR